MEVKVFNKRENIYFNKKNVKYMDSDAKRW